LATVGPVSTRDRRTRRRRLPPEEAKQALLEAGRDHVYEHPLGEPLDHVRVTDIADRVGLSIGAVYHYWDSQDDYRDDLIDLLLSADEYPAVRRTGDVVADAIAADPPLEELVRAAATISFDGLAELPGPERLVLAMVAYGDDEIDARLGAQSRELSSRWADLFRAYFPRYGIEPRPPFTYDSIAVVLMGLVQGMNVRRAVDPASVTGEVAEGWDLVGSAALAFLLSACRPIDGEADVAEADRSLLDLAEKAIPRRTPGPDRQ
jgi:AcrR family transcriptional regulator